MAEPLLIVDGDTIREANGLEVAMFHLLADPATVDYDALLRKAGADPERRGPRISNEELLAKARGGRRR